MSQPDYDRNLTTDIPSAIKAKITEYRIACEEYAFVGAKAPEERQQVIDDLCIRRYNLERTIATYLEKGVKT